MGGLIDMEEKGCESIGCWTHNVTLTDELDLDLQGHFVTLNFDLLEPGKEILRRNNVDSFNFFT